MIAPDNRHSVISRSFKDDQDFWKIRNLLIETYPIAPPAFNWEVRRWDGQRFHRNSLEIDSRWRESIRLWETAEGRLVGVVHPEGTGEAHLEVHPDFRHIEKDMINWAWEKLASPANNAKKRKLKIYPFENDSLRCDLLKKLDFKPTDTHEVQRRLSFDKPLPPILKIADGNMVRTLNPNDHKDCRGIAELLNAAFGRDFHTAGEIHNFTTNAPCFYPDLDLVAVDSGDQFAAYVGIPYIEENRYGVFEPVCTHPNHLRQGLARTLMLEGLYRLKKIGAVEVWVGTGDQEAANKLYEGVGFTEVYRKALWIKEA